MKTMAMLVVLVMVASAAPAGEIHQWRDADGHTHFGDRPPPEAKSTVVKVRTNVYTSPSIEALSKAVLPARQVVMYSASWCGYCKKARNYFNSHAIAFSEYDVETSDKGQRDYERLGAHGVPVILVGEQRMNGFSEAAFESIYKPH